MNSPELITESEFTLPSVYDGMDEYFGGDPMRRVSDIIEHYEQHLEFLKLGYYEASPGIIDNSIKSITSALLEAEATDLSNPREVFQIELKHAAVMNQLRGLSASEDYNLYYARNDSQ